MEPHTEERDYQAELNGTRDGGVHTPLVLPDTPRFGEGSPSLQDSTRNSFLVPPTPEASHPFLTGGASEEKLDGGGGTRPASRRRRWPLFVLAGAVAVVVIVLAVVLPVTLVHKHSSHSAGSSGASAASPTSNPESPTGAVSGGNGTVIKMDNNQTFTYVNNFGGVCEYRTLLTPATLTPAAGVDDPANPFNNSARAQSYTPSLDEEWVWGQDLIRGALHQISSPGREAQFCC